MKTLYEIYEEIANNVERWFYYTSLLENETNNDTINKLRNNLINSVLHKDCDEIEANRKAKEFSDTYFTIGGKGLLASIFKDHIDSLQRGDHTLSVFLLGIQLAELFGILSPDNEENEGNGPYNKDGFNFKYYWFLACLYHDVGYVYENSTYLDESIRNKQERENKLQDNLSALRTDGLEAIQEICDIRYLHNRVFKTYDRSEIDLYLKGRATCCNCIDHGIAGGLMLYDKLRKQFEQSWQSRYRLGGVDRTSFWNNKGLHLSNCHFEEYAKAANAIISHNIWIDTLNNYKQLVKTPLVTKNRISFQKDPLCFILSLADTIEPLKKNIGLNCIKLGCGDDTNSFIIEISADVENRKEYIKCVKKLSDWLNVTVSGGDCRAIISVGRE